MADRDDAQILEVVRCQIGQQFARDVILAECRLVLFKAERSQPFRDVSIAAPCPSRAAGKACALSASICPAATTALAPNP